ncbi:tryptophan synthase subunit alpha [Maioricimonas rarisocia]|uniref:tryptophan synthase subunit alpha n=1 Tax=Maioricimonas rarisocia TaxID=2528026 RepID=UPI00119F7897|nr:tryptophan synthase subunit alpha [Maioricimonas rarisocia]
MTTAISSTFERLRSEGRLAFMPFVTAGDPDLTATVRLIRELAGKNVDLIEVGFPYSDPIADGPVIQASYTRALEHKLTVRQIFDAIAGLPKDGTPPLVAMVSFAIIFRHGPETFVQEAKEAGFAGFIVPDLPGDEATEFFGLTQKHGLDLVQLVAPTTPRERVKQVLASCSGFVYCIAVAGITGVREQVAENLLSQLEWLRQETDLPLAVGFGISRPEHVDPLRERADGVIVGSGIVRHFQRVADGEADVDAVLEQIGAFAGEMVAAAHGSEE